MLTGLKNIFTPGQVCTQCLKRVRETLMRKVQSHDVSLHITHTLIVLGKSVTTGNANAAVLFLLNNAKLMNTNLRSKNVSAPPSS